MPFQSLSKAFLFYYFRPDLIDYEKLSKVDAEQNLEQAFDVAETQLGITPLLDPEGRL